MPWAVGGVLCRGGAREITGIPKISYENTNALKSKIISDIDTPRQ